MAHLLVLVSTEWQGAGGGHGTPLSTFKGRPSPGVHLAEVCALVLKKTPVPNTRSVQFRSRLTSTVVFWPV